MPRQQLVETPRRLETRSGGVRALDLWAFFLVVVGAIAAGYCLERLDAFEAFLDTIRRDRHA